jgi:hypothetical protein
MFLANPFFTALVVPLALLFCGSLSKKIVRGTNWERKDFFMGVEFTLAALSSALLYIFDLANGLSAADQIQSIGLKLAITTSFIAITFCSLFIVIALHQEYEVSKSRRKQIIYLCLISNLVGAGLIAGFVLLVKGIQL